MIEEQPREAARHRNEGDRLDDRRLQKGVGHEQHALGAAPLLRTIAGERSMATSVIMTTRPGVSKAMMATTSKSTGMMRNLRKRNTKARVC